jgi:hypothetical protein
MITPLRPRVREFAIGSGVEAQSGSGVEAQSGCARLRPSPRSG